MTDHIETPDEIEASLRKREELFERWAKSREAANVVTKSAPATRRTSDVMSSEFKIAMEAVGETLGKLRADLRAEFKDQLESELLKLRNEFLADRLDEARGLPKRPLRVVPPTESMIG